VLGCEFARIQFTPDLRPADITGTNVFNFQRASKAASDTSVATWRYCAGNGERP
jgi:MoxR-like ATPase